MPRLVLETRLVLEVLRYLESMQHIGQALFDGDLPSPCRTVVIGYMRFFSVSAVA